MKIYVYFGVVPDAARQARGLANTKLVDARLRTERVPQQKQRQHNGKAKRVEREGFGRVDAHAQQVKRVAGFLTDDLDAQVGDVTRGVQIQILASLASGGHLDNGHALCVLG